MKPGMELSLMRAAECLSDKKAAHAISCWAFWTSQTLNRLGEISKH